MRRDYTPEHRRYTIIAILIVIALIYIIRLFTLQVISTEYFISAENNAYQRKTVYPSRGLIYDRNGELLVYNQPAYDVIVIPKEIDNLDTTALCSALNITREELEKRFDLMQNRRFNPGYSVNTPQQLISQISISDYGRLQEQLYKFKGFSVRDHLIRGYERDIAGALLGNIREVSKREIEQDPYYKRGDYIGDLGVERSYEEYLRGVKGEEIYLRDARGIVKGKFENGAYDTESQSGRDITLSIDAALQEFGEELMQNKKGAIVAIEPNTGEVLAIISAPTYNPSLLVGRDRGKNYQELLNDPTKPLFDRAIKGTYPPGSTFKPAQGLIFLQEEVITPTTQYDCKGGFSYKRLRVGCHAHKAPLSLNPAIATSCNAFFCCGLIDMLGDREKYPSTSHAFEVWKNYLVSMGYGYKLDIDLMGEVRGFIPNSQYYDKYYGKNRWYASTIISISIGQGEILATPLQIANLSAQIANRGYFYTPHVVKAIQDTIIDAKYREKHQIPISESNYQTMVEGMHLTVLDGSCKAVAIPNIDMCAKTGTSQNPHGKDHSSFIGFAPKDNPQIAIAVYIENAGFGATYAAPIGSLMIEKYLTDTISANRQPMLKRMQQAKLIK